MPGRLTRIVSAVARRVAALPLTILPPDWRVQVLDRLNREMICTAQVPGGAIRFFAPSPLLRSRASTVLSKEADTIRWIDGFADGDVFWDIGANVGVFGLYAAVRKRISVFCFEPSAANFHVLARNIHLNCLSDRVTAYCVAFSNATQLGVLNLASAEMGGALSQFGQPGQMSRYADSKTQACVHGMVGMSMDGFVSQFAPPFPNHIKMDVDGLELPILNGARQTLADRRLKSLMVELSLTNETERREALHLLGECGWKLASQGDSQGTPTERAANHFFARV